MQEAQMERRLRRLATRHGLRIIKSRRYVPDHAQFNLVDANAGYCVISPGPCGGVTLAEVEQFLRSSG